jgi:hypothetical protein
LYELMFDSKTKITNRLTDAADLLIDFATLGEYGLEPVGRTRQGCADLPAASPRRRPTAPPATRANARNAHCSLAEESGLFRTRRTRPGQPV